MENIIYKLDEIIWSYPLIILLIFTHIFLTIKLKFPQKHIVKGLRYMFDKKEGDGISSFNSLMTVLAATLGTGNIVGVSAAIIIGGIGSIFWIFLSGIFAIATKYAETYLCLKYRKKDKVKKYSKTINKDNTKYYGGTMYVLEERIGKKWLAILFSIFVIMASLGIGCMIQSNSACLSITESFNVNINVVATIITLISVVIIFSEAKKISKISSIVVPISTIVYLSMLILLLIIFRNNIYSSVVNIIKDAFNFKSGAVGIISFFAMKSLSVGLSKGMFSNEAGMGSSPIFECTVNEDNLVRQTIISSTSVFIDTVILCTLTGITLVSSNMYISQTNAISLVRDVFSVIPFGNVLLTFSLVSFALATIPCWSYYGSQAMKYIFKSDIAQILYKSIFSIAVYIGCVSTLKIIWSISSIANAFMILPNLFMIYYLINEIKTSEK